jgi:ElaB/YqjD/DUF883 family membrane-anchored ribosome-binding protein
MSIDSPLDPPQHPDSGAPDDAFARLEKEMQAMKNAIGDLSNQISDAAGDISATAQDQVARGYKHARSNVDSIVSDASDRAGAVASIAQAQALSIGEALEDVIRERPLSTAAVALGLGFLIGVAWRR